MTCRGRGTFHTPKGSETPASALDPYGPFNRMVFTFLKAEFLLHICSYPTVKKFAEGGAVAPAEKMRTDYLAKADELLRGLWKDALEQEDVVKCRGTIKGRFL